MKTTIILRLKNEVEVSDIINLILSTFPTFEIHNSIQEIDSILVPLTIQPWDLKNLFWLGYFYKGKLTIKEQILNNKPK